MTNMAGTEPASARKEVAGWVGNLGVLATLLAALILTAVLLGNLFVLVFKVPINPWLLVLVEAGPVLGVFFSNIGTGINYYGTWRVLRGLDEYDVKVDARNQAQGVPGLVQWVPQALLGCLPTVSAGLLAVSLLTSLLTLAPAPVHLLGYSAPSSGKQDDSPSGGSGGQARPTPTPTPPSRVRFSLRGGTVQQRCDSPSSSLSAVVLTLDNTASDAAVTWQLTQIDALGGTGQPWAVAGATQGTIAAGHFDTLALVPDAQVCSAVAAAGTTLHATLSVAGADTYTISDQVTAPPRLLVKLGPASQTQTCPSFHTTLPTIAVTLDNSASNVDANWRVTDVQRIPGVPQPWATPRQGSGTVRAGQQATITLTPNPRLCYWNPLGGHTYRATVRVAGGPSFTIADAVIAPRLAALSLAQSGTPATCDAALHIGSYAVTLSNTGNVPAVWRFDANDAAPSGKPWAAASPASGTLAAGGQQTVTLTPDASICTQAGGTTATYHATIVPNGGTAFAAIALSDTITVPAVTSIPSTSVRYSQTCDDGSIVGGGHTVTLDNTAGNVPIKWTFTPAGSSWATAAQSDGKNTIGAGKKKEVTVTTDAGVCDHPGVTTYHATIRVTSPAGKTLATISVEDTVTVPDISE